MIVQLLSRFRLLFLALPLLYVLVLAGIALARSHSRHSVVRGAAFVEASSEKPSGDAESTGSNVHLEHFERVEFKGGAPIWSVKASDAHYFPLDAVTIVNQPVLRIYRNKEDDVVMKGDVARLAVQGSALLEARMDGHVGGELGSGITFLTTQGDYQVKDRVFRTREQMSIQGTGFEVSGDGFIYHFDTGVMEFEHKVLSVFKSGAVPPKDLSKLGPKSGAESAEKKPNEAHH